MAQKNINARLQNKHDVEANWVNAIDFIPLQGEIIVYDVDENYNYERIKIGDGTTKINDLPFVTEPFETAVLYEAQELTDEQKAQARANVGAVNSWNDLENKPFGEELILIPVESDCASGTIVTTEENERILFSRVDSSFLDQENSFYVKWDDILYEVVYDPNWFGIGNMSLYDSEYLDTGEPFCIMQGMSNSMLEIYAKEPGTHTYAIYTGASSIKTLDEIYIPDTIARVEDQPNWSQNDETAVDYIKNRPFYEGVVETDIAGLEFTVNISRATNSSGDQIISGGQIIEHNMNLPLALGQVWKCIPLRLGTIEASAMELEVTQANDGTPWLNGDVFYIKENTSFGTASYVSNGDVYSIKIVGISGTIASGFIVHQLDEKFVPDTIARTDDLTILPIEKIADFGAICTPSVAGSFYRYQIYLPSTIESHISNYIFKAQIPDNYDTQHVLIGFKNPDSDTMNGGVLLMGLKNAVYLWISIDKANKMVACYEILSNREWRFTYDDDGKYVSRTSTTNITSDNLVTQLNSLLEASSYVPSADTDVATKGYVDSTISGQIATDDEILELLAQEDMLPVVADSDGALLADENNNILLW